MEEIKKRRCPFHRLLSAIVVFAFFARCGGRVVRPEELLDQYSTTPTLPPYGDAHMPPSTAPNCGPTMPSPPVIPAPSFKYQSPPPPATPLYSPPHPPPEVKPLPPIVYPSPPEVAPYPSPPEDTPLPPVVYPSPPEVTPSPRFPGLPEFPSSPPDVTPFSGPPEVAPSPPEISPFPGPPEVAPSPPEISPFPGPPSYVSGPPEYAPEPQAYAPEPPGVAPGPSACRPEPLGPPENATPEPGEGAEWCVAKPSVPRKIMQQAIDSACGSGADCNAVKAGGACFEPDTMTAHASYAFNSYWQRTKSHGGTCDFGGTAMLINKDPSYGSCHYSAR